jgi:hypothetical protein
MKAKVAACLAVRRVTVLLGLLLTSGMGWGADSLVSTGAVWKYLDNGTDQGTAWRAPGFDDSAWASGPAQLGYGDGDEATIVSYGPDAFSKYITTYFRRAFNVADASAISNLTLRVLRDDGVVVYLNGVEVFRSNLLAGAISFNTLATVVVGGAEETSAFIAADISAASLVTGVNVVAAEIHQVNATSSDISFDLELLAEAGPGNTNTNLPPTVRLVTPTDGAVFNAPANIPLLANANDPNGYLTLQYVEFFAGANSLGIRTNFPTLNPVGPFALQWTNVPRGDYTLTAVAVDDHAAKATSAPVHISVQGAPPPPGPVALIASNSVWKYLDNGTDQGTAWRGPGFDDSTWAAGRAQLGYGDGDETTAVSFGPNPNNKFITTYFRRGFEIASRNDWSNLTARLLQDDGAVVYLNGVEVVRANLPPGEIFFNTLALAAVENQMIEFALSPSLLVDGRNVVAVEMHQVNPASSDLSFDFQLTAAGAPPERTVVNVVATDPDSREVGPLGFADLGTFTISRSGRQDFDLPVYFSLSGTASNGVDYLFISNRVVIPAGSAYAAVMVSPLNDRAIEGTETVVLTLEPPVCIDLFPPPPECYLVGPSNRATVFIGDYPPTTNRPPAVTIVMPANGDTFPAGTNILLGANAPDPDSFVQTVEFFAGTQSLGLAGGPFDNFFAEWLLDWTNVPPGEYSLTAKATDNHGAMATSAPVHIIVQGEPPGDRELHVVGIYSGASQNGGPVPNHERGNAAVTVNRPGKSVTLLLASYEPVDWHVSVSAGTGIERIFLTSYYSNAVDGLPPGVPVTTVTLGYIGYSLEASDYYRALPRICALTGQDLASFHGNYTAPYPTPFVIDSVQNDPRLRCDYPQPVPTNNLPPLNFRLAFFGSGRGVYFQNYTLAGPQGGASLLPDVLAVPDSSGRYYYAADPHFVWKIDSQTGSAQNMQLPPSVPELSWPVGIAFDSMRQRVLLVSLGGEGFLYAYSPAQDTWSLVSSMNNLDLDSLVYHAPSDSLFGVGVSWGDGHPVIHELSADGAPRRTIQLPVQPFRIDPGDHRSELASVGEYLVLLIGPRYSWQSDQESRMYLIDPRTGDVWLTYRQIHPPPNQPPFVSITSPTNSAVFTTEDRVLFGADASDADGTISSVEIILDGESLGNAAGPNGSSHGTWRLFVGPLGAGPHTFAAKATDNRGAMTTSAAVSITVEAMPDSDGDGVPDARDRCPSTAPGAAVNEHGCSIAQLCPCDGPWRNHGEYVDCVVHHAWQFFRDELITADQRRVIVRDAVRSNCGRHIPAEPVRIHLLPLTLEECHRDGVQFVISGDAVGNCVIESSTDLLHWTSVQTLNAADMGNEVACPHSSGEPSRFFRVREDAP